MSNDSRTEVPEAPRAAATPGAAVAVRRGPVALAVVILVLTQLMSVVDTSIVNVALPDIGRELGFSSTGLSWVVTAYALAFGGLILLSGKVGSTIATNQLTPWLLPRLGERVSGSTGRAGLVWASPGWRWWLPTPTRTPRSSPCCCPRSCLARALAPLSPPSPP
ncbi:hypothetical protein [Streptomyces sp. NPDC096105]|uniref:hypothetical protein n=1 Tax=Streptomyces sp. NPDC096105 TaxID=3366074 RepID=UPI003821CF5C